MTTVKDLNFDIRISFINELLSPLNNGKVGSHLKTSSSKINKYSFISHQNNYYKIKFDKVRSFHYDFIQDMIVEDYKYEANKDNYIVWTGDAPTITVEEIGKADWKLGDNLNNTQQK